LFLYNKISFMETINNFPRKEIDSEKFDEL
jgi:hypothetical protein